MESRCVPYSVFKWGLMSRITILLLLATFVLSCTAVKYPRNPIDVYAKYHEAIADGDFEGSLRYVTKGDIPNMRAEFSNPMYASEMISEMYRLATWKLEKIEVNEDEAVIKLQVHEPNYGAAVGAAIANALIDALYEEGIIEELPEVDEEAREKAKAVVEALSVEWIDYEKKVTFLREDGKWKIYFKREFDEEIEKLSKEARELRYEGKLDEAKAILKQMENLNDQHMYYKLLKYKIKCDEIKGEPSFGICEEVMPDFLSGK